MKELRDFNSIQFRLEDRTRKMFLGCICISLIFFKTGLSQQSGAINSISVQLQGLLDEGDYFKLESKYKLYKKKLSAEKALYFQAFIKNAFNRNREAISDINTLLNQPGLSDSMKARLLILQKDCYFKLFQYEKAALSIKILLDHYSATLDSDKIADIKNDQLVYDALKNTPAQATLISAETTINWTKDQLGLTEIPVRCNNKTYNSIFDTRANVSSISQTYAASLNLKMLDVSFEESSGMTGMKFQTGLGIADSIYIGNILVRNVVFQVMPDSILYIAPAKFSINIIIGYPVIEQLKEIHIYNNGKMVIPARPSKSNLHNLAMDELDPVISLRTGDDTLCFHFDLGAASTDLYANYFEKYKESIISKGQLKTIEIGGAGGSQKKEVYFIPSLDLYLGNKKITLTDIDVLTQKVYAGQKFYGNIGQDLVKNSGELILNFDSMYIDVK